MMDFQAARFSGRGVVPQQSGNDHPYSTRWGGCPHRGWLQSTSRSAGRANGSRFCGGNRACRRCQEDPHYATQIFRLKNRKALNAKLADILR